MSDKILVSLSNFKGSLSNQEATDIVKNTLNEMGYEAYGIPIGDGGLGTITTVHQHLGGEWLNLTARKYSTKVEPVETKLLCLPNVKSPVSIYIESSPVIGGMRDPMNAHSGGLGELILHAIKVGGDTLKTIYIGLGDSSVSEAGMGMLTALGFVFKDKARLALRPGATTLREIEKIEPPKHLLTRIKFVVLCDVQNPLCGDQGCARVFSPQKGASPEQVKIIDEGMENVASIILKETGKDVRLMPMGGSVGGISTALFAFLGAELVPGARFLLDWIGFDETLVEMDMLVVGEGKSDAQTLSGKAPTELIARAKKLRKKVVIISGSLEKGYEHLLKDETVVDVHACGKEPDAKTALENKTREVFRKTKTGYVN